ncbi:MAG TPA: glutamine amidotransferase [Kofleriaceae bacterium]|nr:glutamine amidotransferase [Kofleriaceae bacterium]
MNVELLSAGQRWLALVVLLASTAAAVILARRGARGGWVAAASGLAVVAAGALLAHLLVGWVVARAAPSDADYNEYHWVLLSPWGRRGLALGAAAALAVALLGLKGARGVASPWRRSLIAGLRIAAAACALVLFLEPAIELRQVAREPNRIAVVVDESRSMALRDQPDGPTRQQRVRRLLDDSAETFAAWRSRHHIDFYGFADVLAGSSEASAAAHAPTGAATQMRQALENTRSRYDGRDLAGIVLISDGVATDDFADGAEDGAARDMLRALDTRVHTVWAGRPGLRDVAIAKVMADEFAFVRTVVKIEALVRSTGYGRRRLPVTLSAEGKPMRQKWVELGPGEVEARVEFEITPPKVGKYVYEIATPVAADEAVAENNSRAFVMRVIRDKIRVLQVAGQPSWDVQALRRMLKENPNVDLISFFILRTAEDLSLVPNDELSLIPFPTHELFLEELPSFDLIVLQNFEYAPYGIGVYLENIRQYVAGGGGLAMLGGGHSFASGGYSGSPLEEALPVELPSPMRAPRDLLDTRMFRPVLTAQGEGHPVTALRYDVRDNQNVWATLPELEGVNLVGDAKKGAAVLAVHPTLTTPSRKRMPVVVAGDYGEGRTLVVTTDSLWRWGFVAAADPGSDSDGRYYDKLWENAMRWLIQDPELRHLHVDSDHPEYTPQQSVRLDVRLLDVDYTPLAGAPVDLVISRGADAAATEEVARATVVTGAQGEASHVLGSMAPGVYRVRATSTMAGRPVDAQDIFLVREGSAELDRPAADDHTLQAIAGTTGGRYLGKVGTLPRDLPFDEPRVIRVDRRTDVELWSRPGLLVLALMFLGFEWLLRQRSGTL